MTPLSSEEFALRTSHVERAPSPPGLVVLIPIYNDWEAVQLLLPDLERALTAAGITATVLLVDDGSTSELPPTFYPPDAQGDAAREGQVGRDAGLPLRLLTLRRNVGHQRAIAIGLSFIEATLPCRAVIVMDGDGEDAPSDVPRLVSRMTDDGDRAVVFAERTRRSENLVFRIGYFLYRQIHLALTGIKVRVGNFSVVPRAQLRRLVVVSDLWNHFAAAIFRAKIPFVMVPCQRARRLSGYPKMNLVSLVGHGLSAMSVFGDRIGTRMLIASSLLVGASLSAIVAIGAVAGLTGVSMRGWQIYAVGLFVMLLLQALLFSLVFVFIILASRNMSGFVPARDYGLFIEDFRALGSVTAAGAGPGAKGAG